MTGKRYEILVEGILDRDWGEWFDGMEIRQVAEGQTVIAGVVVDQAALHGILAKLRDLNLVLVSVNPESDEGE